jgi:hypothetical protein
MNTKAIYGVVQNGKDSKKSYWTQIGIAFENRDGSWNLLFNYFPADRYTTIQIREPRRVRAELAESEGQA